MKHPSFNPVVDDDNLSDIVIKPKHSKITEEIRKAAQNLEKQEEKREPKDLHTD